MAVPLAAVSRLALRSCGMSALRCVSTARGAPGARSLRSLVAAAAARRSGGSGSGLPRALRPLQAALAGAEQHAAAADVPDGADGMHSLAAAGVLEPQLTWPARSHHCGELTEGQVGGWPCSGALVVPICCGALVVARVLQL